MGRRIPVRLTLVYAALAHTLLGCLGPRQASALDSVVCTADSGSILPELQWVERYTIRLDGVTLERRGKIDDSQVTAGDWPIAVDRRAVEALFGTLQAADTRAIRKIEAGEPQDGAGTRSYTLTYADGRTFELLYDPDTTYLGAESVVEPIDAFLNGLDLP